jgi:mannose-1-phosphate guanylyltransferase/mannose-6-phosphate isomerase
MKRINCKKYLGVNFMYNFTILCGGSGSRLWPQSREKLPKQFLKLTNEYTMFQNTILRIMLTINKIETSSKINIICNQDHYHLVEKQIIELKIDVEYKIICEPKGRDSAPAVCISSLVGSENDYTFIIPCDHVFDDNEFSNCVIKSLDFLETSIVTFGIKPTRIETGYGYIQLDEERNTIQFIEKPNYETAKLYLESGNYLWNAGIFAFKNKNMLSCFEKYANDIRESCLQTLKNTDMNSNIINLSKTEFMGCRAISVDYAIMEHLCKDHEITISKKTILYNSSWNDIGSYIALYDELLQNPIHKDKDNNIISGDVLSIDTNNCYINSHEKLTATIGIKDLIVVNTDDSLLICNNTKTQDVKKIVEQLKQLKREEVTVHKTAFRPWGYYKNVEGNDNTGFKVKRISVYPGKRLSLQSHNHRSEHWVIVKGTAKVQVGDDTLFLSKDQHVYIPINTLHRIENIGDDLLEFTETQIGDYLGEDDIVRYEDDFGRI